MLVRITLASATVLSIVSLLSAGEKENTHVVTPSELLSAVGNADKIVVYDGTPTVYKGGGVAPQEILYSSANTKDISELRAAIAIEPPKGWFRCACIPPIEIILSRSGKELGVISVQET